MTPILAFIFSPLGRYAIIALVAVGAVTGIYVKGRSDGRTAYKAKIEREIKNAIDKGDAARERALRDFDASPDSLPDDGFRRP
jgi:hypothetical protein